MRRNENRPPLIKHGLKPKAKRLAGVLNCVFASVLGSEHVRRFLEEDTQDLLGSAAILEIDPKQLASRITGDLKRRWSGIAIAKLIPS
jgi:anaerobic carbon-monoxide dehydrogenase catalytic subunit